MDRIYHWVGHLVEHLGCRLKSVEDLPNAAAVWHSAAAVLESKSELTHDSDQGVHLEHPPPFRPKLSLVGRSSLSYQHNRQQRSS